MECGSGREGLGCWKLFFWALEQSLEFKWPPSFLHGPLDTAFTFTFTAFHRIYPGAFGKGLFLTVSI